MSSVLLFAYGTLQQNQCNFNVVERYVRHIHPGSIKGRLYSIEDDYPAVILDQENGYPIYGQWLTIESEGLTYTDQLEEYEEHGSSNYYERVYISDLQQNISGFIYIMLTIPKNCIEIYGGSWLQYCNEIRGENEKTN